ncbi:hypothetical protein E4U30_003054 [Claviceps sp. LM220 group G6]|nr:hypothetical protein E4U15_007028 [Claviceps sp. LM218 group G6]KAG6094761.1 hypothetical protein E4U30_003054 [Claviceps sp. LM220 group G6]KAG6111056.1 hypothetical protein E4U14_002593 [Claviceps sp. LM454 group G7]
MPGPQKRAFRDVIDLTGDYGSQPEAKRHLPATANLSTGLGGSSVYNPLPVGTQLSQVSMSSSQPMSFSQTAQYENEVLDLTQDDDGPARELYGVFNGKIVGIQYYKGQASPGEVVLCHREPENQYDRNAIRVDNVMSQQIGHLPRQIVQKLAKYVASKIDNALFRHTLTMAQDSGDLVIEASLAGYKGTFDCPVKLALFGPSSSIDRARIEKSLKSDKIVTATELKRTRIEAESKRTTMGLKAGRTTHGFGSAGPHEPEVSLEDILKDSESIDLRGEGDAIKPFAMDEKYLSEMPMAEQPTAVKATLLPYQLQGLAWMTLKESPVLPTKELANVVQLWKQDHKGNYWNAATNYVSQKPPELFSGGILADDMGLGKTLQIISLIMAGGPGTTLIVAPVSVMSNWKQQIERHVKAEFLPSVFIYHGDKKATDKELMNYNVVITSYGKLAREKDAKVPQVLLSKKIQWRRVVLDEGHIIRNANTKLASAACAITAKSRWVLTGTPIVNSVKDLQSMVKFLHITGGIEQPEIFNTKVTRKLASGDPGAEAILQALMQDICLRRKKDMKFVDLKLPPKKEYLHRVTFHPEEKRKYDGLLAEARGALANYQATTAARKGQFQGVLEQLLRLRQTCNHWMLCKDRIDELMKTLEGQDVVPFNEENTKLLRQALRLYIENQEDCAICYEVPKSPVITNCKHVFCRACITRAVEIQHKCPLCRNELTQECFLEPAPETTFDEKFDTTTQSSKTQAAMQIIQATLSNPGSKIVIFSQWTSFLNIVQNELNSADIQYCRVDGSMNADKRDRAIRALDTDPETRIMLASLAVCSVGLNLVSADTVILLDSWWAPAIEDQAIDRVHRLGQTRETTVWRLIVEGTVEERVLDIQQEKRKLVTKAFQEKEKRGKGAKETRMGDIAKLLS